ncbi:acyl carrier protein [Streptomyces luteolifulvus]|uniref:Acyl carrier protein n=1 Tax=Streptomyces luteolifulvus TaxID=2615112 RepID=A0A6H9USB9_9ACTN|nr:phosphopantetheine-binding protein [Streptomyces luteolifulvus]KAB1141297.1 acyl carrier protein [Streptomyces luteolifulvus]
MKRTEALDMVREAISQVIPDADVAALGPDDAFRDVLEMDSLDFLSFVEVLSERSGVRIEDDDTPRLTTLSDSADFVVAHTQ